MKIAICTIGSRGDVLPFLVLGDALAKRGHEVRLATAAMYAPLASRYGVAFVPFKGDYAAFVESGETKKAIGGNPLTAGRRLREKLYPIIEHSLDTFFDVALWADRVIYHPKTLVDAFGSRFPQKLIKAYVVPAFTPTTAFPSPIYSGLPIPRFLNKATYRITRLLTFTVRRPLQAFYAKHGMDVRFKTLNAPTIYGISQYLVPRPSDYPPHHHFTGFWFDKPSDTELPEHLLSFLKTPKKKLAITFGSMPYKSRVPVDAFIRAVRERLDVRIVLVRGWGLKAIEIAESQDVLAIDFAPFDRLFPLVDAVVHHGGVGTTAMALKSGRPMMILPVLYPFGDQMFWGKQVHRQGLGVEPVPLSKLMPSHFGDAVRTLLEADFSSPCSQMRKALGTEDGISEAIRFISQSPEWHM